MKDITPASGTAATAEFHAKYVDRINHLVSQDREVLIPDLTAEYEQALRSADEDRPAA